MKVDKDTLIKHHFWILVGLSVPFAAVAILLLVTSVSGHIQTLRDGLKKKLAEVKMNTHTPEDVAKKQIEASYLVKKETDAWGKAFREQEPLLRWPRRIEATYHFADGLFATDVHLIKLPAEKGEWPADKPGELMHGLLLSADDSQFKIVDKDGKNQYVFYATPKLSGKGGVTDDRGDKKELVFSDLSRQTPKETAVAVTYQKARYFNDRLTTGEQIDYKKYYLSQIPPILQIVDPVHVARDDDGKPYLAGVVQFNAGGWTFDAGADQDYDEIPDKVKEKLIPPGDARFLRFVNTDWNISNDISDEAWIAQEDLWIQKEIYRLIRSANDSLSAFDEVPGSRNNKTKSVSYKNPYFAVNMQLKDADTLQMTIANLLNRRQKVESMKVRVRFTDPTTIKNVAPEVFSVVSRTQDADPLEPKGDPKKGDVRTITVKLKKGPRRDGIYSLEQVLTWETAAVKRIDQVAIGSLGGDDIALSQKLMANNLRPYIEKPKEEAAASDTKAGGGAMAAAPSTVGVGGGAGQTGNKFQGSRAGGPGPGGMGGDKGGGTVLANGLVAERYLEVTPQFRRLPVAVVLIVDQNQVDRVLTAFNNSRLRFLMSQVLLNHYTKSVKPDLPGETPTETAGGAAGPSFGPVAGPGMIKPGGPGAFRPGGKGPAGGFGSQGGFLGPMGGATTGDTGHAAASTTDDLEANMEVVIYGIVTLYERYPPRSGQPGGETAKAP